MTREEEMWKSVENEHGVLSKREAFVALTAMEWADETMIDKACEWLKSRLNYVEDYIGDLQVCSVDCETVEEFITAFRQAMEEGAE